MSRKPIPNPNDLSPELERFVNGAEAPLQKELEPVSQPAPPREETLNLRAAPKKKAMERIELRVTRETAHRLEQYLADLNVARGPNEGKIRRNQVIEEILGQALTRLKY